VGEDAHGGILGGEQVSVETPIAAGVLAAAAGAANESQLYS
jgi:hypothetical protein